MSHKDVIQDCQTNDKNCPTSDLKCNSKTQYIDFNIVIKFILYPQENNLLEYLRDTYSSKEVDAVKKDIL
jgi:hypothetical protein